ncbi:MAG: alpha/beta hydrolase [Oscillatoriaceae bacterium SKW80]|nr:alpha/beta hydrolase [Oscillatoriaceae bacterium SKYG93]MCX8119335.1 alpha/beta hydrolase [Oscillatoriaceae bacterium SKW80]MDW8454802.1 alpha/beta hydrolase [Oscillatoriaceae cyanobacterium SKYGB_i_bin93]HIK28417.1 alpha/beta hydrolase [Oscillatoriaceae cyanobacterium M7585_C2015_266]
MTISNPTVSTPETQFYTWKGYRCAYSVHFPTDGTTEGIPLLLIHPIGVGLSRQFWQRFCREWHNKGYRNPIYNPDLLGCGESDKPRVAYTPTDWAEQLKYYIETVIQKPVIALAQGGLTPVAVSLTQFAPDKIRALVLSGAPGWAIITKETPAWQHKVSWNLFDSPLGKAFYRYARRRQFLQSFSIKQLFENANSVDGEWLDTLEKGAANLDTRYAVFSFLAGFWRKNYQGAIASISQPTLVIVGEKATNISREGKQEPPRQRLSKYLEYLQNGQGRIISGRNVLPYESTAEFVASVAEFVATIKV